ncbi:phosphatase PAP2 family protein [Limnohabitans sp. DM1]|uniref:phosphatase PAP2 family protein n=1 Tax=Limnohabitans sp. DM1 TaxID=1597955 RepID=UPI000A56C7C9|nr:phosphatase PAP2 family protein [Limnohabitans sp. DM1]
MNSSIKTENSFWRQAWNECKKSMAMHRRFMVVAFVTIMACGIFPSDIASYRDETPLLSSSFWLANATSTPVENVHTILEEGVQWVENRGRFISTAAQVMIPLLLNDKVGLAQMLYSGLATTVTTHFLKRVKNDVHIGQTRLGERPNGGRHNVPSGHSSMAGSALGFVWRRYGAWHLMYLLPILIATMATRVFLSAHTISAVLAGAILGVVVTYVMTSPRKVSVAM